MVSNKQIKIIKSLKLKKNQIKHNLFVAEGDKTILELILADFKINSLYSINTNIEGIDNSVVQLSKSELRYRQVSRKRTVAKIKINKASINSKEVKKNSNHILEIKHNLTTEKIPTSEIKWIEALGDYVKLITNDKSYVILSTMKAFENELPKKLFLRIHKSYIVNLKKVERYDSKYVEIEKIKLPLSRTRKLELSQALDI